MQKLSKRLCCAADLVPEGAYLADIGTDHAFLPIALVLQKKIPGAIACDVKEGPLQRARSHVSAAGLDDKIECRISDGLQNIAPGESDAACLCGMGGALIMRILDEGAPEKKGIKTLILGPQSETKKLRSFLLQRGYFIETERLVAEDRKYYFLLRVSVMPHTSDVPYTKAELLYGRNLVREKNPILMDYLYARKAVLERILEELSAAEKKEKRIEEIAGELAIIRGICHGGGISDGNH